VNPSGSPAGTFPVITVTTGGMGANDHTLDAGFTNSTTAASVSIDGRVMLPDGTGIRNVTIAVTGADGHVYTTLSSAFGYFHFAGIVSGQNVVVRATAKRYVFDPSVRLINLSNAAKGVDFVAN
jgi:hypothetical protein